MTYVIPETDLRRQRLLAEMLNPQSLDVLARVNPRTDGRWLDVGSGLGETTKMLASLQSAGGSLVGVDRNADLLAVARAQEGRLRRELHRGRRVRSALRVRVL